MSEIIVAGAGHGGIVAAMKLAAGGHSVTVYEKSSREDLGNEQYDAVNRSFFEYAGIDAPANWDSEPNIITVIPKDGIDSSVTLPPDKRGDTLTVNRRTLIRFLIALAEDAGVKFVFGRSIEGAIVCGSRVAGIKTDAGDIYGDLIIDACGLRSPVRTTLPDFMKIKRDIDKYDLIYTYRACFKRNEDSPDPQNRYKIYAKDDGTVGFCWLVCESDRCDVLIARFHEVDFHGILPSLNMLYEDNPQMGRDVICGGNFGVIPIRQPLPVFVADGYAAVGDSACMTLPLKGSGIGLSLAAGTILAKTALEDKYGLFTAQRLWSYQTAYFKEFGFDCCRMAIIKSILPYLTADNVNEMFKSGIVTTQELAELMDNRAGALLSKKGITAVIDKFKALGDVDNTRKVVTNALTAIVRFALVEPFMPSKYDFEDLPKWYDKYENFFDALRLHEGELTTIG